MAIPYPQEVALVEKEKELLVQISFDIPYGELSQEHIKSSSAAAEALTLSLFERKAIPEIRIRYFSDPKIQIRVKKSPFQMYKDRGFDANEIFKHPGFFRFLRYFIFGPDLPASVIHSFWQRVNVEEFISGSDLPELKLIARNAVRQNNLEPRSACEEFYKLSLECKLSIDQARYIRDVVRVVR